MGVGAAPNVCKQCGSSYIPELATEACIHVPGLENVNFPGVFVFPTLAVCLKCGSVSGFQIPQEQLVELRRYVRGDSGSM